jgi:hypothetical protein
VEVAWDDDAHDRWILWWYRFDPERRQRRNTVVAAFTDEAELQQRFLELSMELQRLKALGEAEEAEHISGVLHPAGYRAMMRAKRAGLAPDVYVRTPPTDRP